MSALAFEGFLSTPEMIEVLGEYSLIQAMMADAAAKGEARRRLDTLRAQWRAGKLQGESS